MKKRLYPIFIFLLGLQFMAQAQEVSLDVNGVTRSMLVYLPTGYQPGMSLPLVINMHGLGSNSLEQRFYSNFNPVADANDFILIYPDGLVDTLASGVVSSHWASYFGSDTDDMSFLHKVIDWAHSFHNIDLSRVYATGMSNGGFMSYRLGCEMSERIAAIASVTGSMALPQFDNCSPARPVPAMQIHGTEDATVPFEGAPGFIPSITEVVDFWVLHNSCGDPVVTDLPDIDQTDMSTVTEMSYTDCQDESEVLFLQVNNGAHTWPGAFPLPGFGVTNQDISASEDIWEFFERHVHPDPAPAEDLTGTAAVFTAEFSVAPNPFQDFIHIKTTAVGTVTLMDVHGRVLLRKAISANDFQLETDMLLAGMYLLKIEDEQGSSRTVKLVK